MGLEQYQIIVHAGGKGTRLLPLTLERPKALLDLNGKALIELAIQPFLEVGVKEFVLTASYKADMIKEFFEDKGLRVNFIKEETPAGRGGAIQLGVKQGILNPEKPAIQIHADDIIKFNLHEFLKTHEERGCLVTLGLAKSFQNPYGIVKIKSGKAVAFIEKPEENLSEGEGINTGLAAFKNLHMFQDVPLPFHPENTIYPRLAEKGEISVYFIEKWWPVNTKEELEKVRQILKQKTF